MYQVYCSAPGDQKRALDHLGLDSMCAGNRTPVFCKSSKHSPALQPQAFKFILLGAFSSLRNDPLTPPPRKDLPPQKGHPGAKPLCSPCMTWAGPDTSSCCLVFLSPGFECYGIQSLLAQLSFFAAGEAGQLFSKESQSAMGVAGEKAGGEGLVLIVLRGSPQTLSYFSSHCPG